MIKKACTYFLWILFVLNIHITTFASSNSQVFEATQVILPTEFEETKYIFGIVLWVFFGIVSLSIFCYILYNAIKTKKEEKIKEKNELAKPSLIIRKEK